MKLFSDTLPFYRGNLHTHTTNSDGEKTPAEAMALYRARGYDFLSLTDHRTVTDASDAPSGLLMLPGIELDYSFPYECVHIVGFGITHAVEDEYNPDGKAQDGIDSICESGGRAILCHPAWSLNSPETITSLLHLSGAEVWNSVSTAPYNAIRADSSSLLDVSAARGKLLPLFANDDTHFYSAELGVGWNMVQAEALTVPEILKGFDTGRHYATQGPKILQIEVTDTTVRVMCSPASMIVFFSNRPWSEGRCITGINMTGAEYRLQRKESFIRCQVVDAEGKSAWTSTILLG